MPPPSVSECVGCSGTESHLWDVLWSLFPGSARAESGADQGACADGRCAGRRHKRPWLLIVLSGTDRLLIYILPASDYCLYERARCRWTHWKRWLAGLKRAEPIAAHTSFFKSGVCVGRTFVCVVKTSPLSSKIKIFEPINQNIRRRNKPTFRKLLLGSNDTIRIYKEFYIPLQSGSIHFLCTKLCEACVNGFEIIDPDTLDTEGLLDPSDESLDFVGRRSDNTRPKRVATYRIENEFLLCYDGACFVSAPRTTTVADFALDRVRVLHQSWWA